MEPGYPEQPSGADLKLQRLRLRYPSKCVLCGQDLAKGSEALYHRAARTTRCVSCPPNRLPTPERALDAGTAGASAHREYERRRTARDARVKARLGNFVGGVALALTGEPQSTAAWERGSTGERKLAAAINSVKGLQVLNDRRVPGTKGNIDHIVIAPAGIFVVDAKRYEGLIRIRDRGSLLKTDDRLYVGSRDCSKLAENMGWQVAAVKRVLESTGGEFAALPVLPVLCFVDGEWPLLAPPESYKGVRLEGARSINGLVSGGDVLNPAHIETLSRALAVGLPSNDRVS
ncbi:MAG TPA: nuclease-related domain-containing protein [Candidatus Dormibacteraeota bacterium]|nr:nuclease-related domain-containing protein [Candidatus Dormibacteraeota bacterium]